MALLSSVGSKIVFIVVVAHCSFFGRPTTVYYHITELDRHCASQQIVKTGNGFDAVYCLSVLPLRNLALRASAPHAPCAWSTRLRAAVRCINEHDIGVLARRDISGHDDANLQCLLYPRRRTFNSHQLGWRAPNLNNLCSRSISRRDLTLSNRQWSRRPSRRSPSPHSFDRRQ